MINSKNKLFTSSDLPYTDVESNNEKIEKIKTHFTEIMKVLNLDLNDNSLKDTPMRVAKMYVNEIFSGIDVENKPVIKLFDNEFNYNQMLVEKDITFFSNCEHHFLPFFGKVHVGYFCNNKVIGLSKLNRIVQYYAKRPQIQERLTVQIAEEMQELLNTKDVAVVIEAFHLCVASRGVNDTNSKTGTEYYSGKFKKTKYINQFINHINAK